MEDNLNSVLNISGQKQVSNSEKDGYGDERTLRTVANIILIVGIFISLILLLVALRQGDTYSYDDNFGFAFWASFSGTLIILFWSVALWALLRVISNMSISLKKLVKKHNTKT